MNGLIALPDGKKEYFQNKKSDKKGQGRKDWQANRQTNCQKTCIAKMAEKGEEDKSEPVASEQAAI